MLEATATTRERLLQAALELTSEGGYAAASVNAIAERAGVAAGTLYRHFASKGELFADLFRVVCSGEVEAMRAAADPDEPVVVQVEDVLTTFAARALRSPRLAWALIAEPVDPLVDAERLAYRETYRELLATLLRDGVEAGELPAQNIDFTAAALVGGIGEALVGPVSPVAADAPNPQEILREIRTFVRRAVGAPASEERA
ncbi:MAG: TetR/AcrR family transcriptional regulator [Solirubrobacteraceae bacterium]|nr:TetR/AcrR family transcriptional regulator [Solirubrobacteraceae bacterium]